MQTSVEAVASKLVDQFDIEMDIYQVSENCMEALNQMGMLQLDPRTIACQLKGDSRQLRMPVDCIEPRAVYGLSNYWWDRLNSTTLTFQNIWFPPQTIFVPVPNSDDNDIYIQIPEPIIQAEPGMSGPYIDFKWEPPFVKVDCPGSFLMVKYNRIPINVETGLCEIPEEAFLACVNYCAFVWFRPMFTTGKIPQYVWNEVKDWKKTAMAQAKVSVMMSGLNENEMSKVHSIMSSFDRKRTRINS